MKVGTLVGRNVKGKTVKSIICKMKGGVEVTLDMKTVDQLVEDKGLEKAGDVQQFHTQNVLRRIKRYMPFQSGVTYKVTVLQTDIRKPEIVTDTPYAKYLFYGKKMVNAKTGKGPALIPGVGYRYKKGTTLKRTENPLSYTKTKNPKVGPHWDRTLVACEGRALTADLQHYINRRKGST